MSIRLAIFDFDGTLADTRRTIVCTQQQTLCELGKRVPDEQTCAATIGLTLTNCFRTLCPELSEDELKQCADIYHQRFDENKRLIPPMLFDGVRETLHRLKERGIAIAIATSRNSRSLHELLEELGISEYVAYTVGGDNVTRPKPDAQPVEMVLSAMGIAAEEAIVVGDMPVDIMMGAGAGVRTCGVSYGNATRKELEDAGANSVIDSIKELTEVIHSA